MHKDRKTLHLISLGCAKNLVDSEILLGGLKNTQYDVTESPDDADTIIINTCGFLDIAREESVDTILQAAELKKKGTIEQLVVMGCLSERYHNDLKKEIPEVDRFFGTNDHKQIASFVTGKDYGKDDPLFFRSILTPSHFAYLKIAEGCDNGCSFCSIPIMRGLQKSRTIPELISETGRLVDNGTKEIMIIAQDTTSYGWDLDKKVYLSDLISEMDKIDNGPEWIRIHYAHPAHLNQRIIDSMAKSDRVCNYIDMPIQHASDNLLRSMRRGLNQEGIRRKIDNLRIAIPDISIRTTVIVGYPGEEEEHFLELTDFISEIKFDHLGVFTYSEEEGTPAADLKDNIPRELKDERKSIIMDLQNNIDFERNSYMVGQSYDVIVDEVSNNIAVGRTQYDSPEIDKIVRINDFVEKGDIYQVEIDDFNEYELIGSLKK
ncbi:MAG: 30S ribosomal protein S12 methylthiotransferase RimO [Candidatus Marinimicrobia bacterium]|nr:30S ribosomal protein S12 methylthiotransferase RimO [Candidatus Neomarinimicrobiota bacterium]